MNKPALFVLGHLIDDDTPVVVSPMEPTSFELVSIKLLRSYQQIARSDFPPRPSGAPALIHAGLRSTFFRVEGEALLALGAAEKIDRHGLVRVRAARGEIFEVPLGDVIEFLTAEVKAALIEGIQEGFSAKIDERGEHMQ